ncbi:MAG: glycosyltransferase family 4 protein [Candidatus Altiarchaeota archaeon]
MKVCMVATDFPVKRGGSSVTYGGAGACMAQLVGGLLEKGVDVSVVTRREDGEYAEVFEAPVYRTDFLDLGFRSAKITHAVTVLPALKRVVKEGGFDVVHSHNPPAAFPAQIAANKNGVPHVTTMHGPWANVRLNPASRYLCSLLEARTLRDADYVTCDSRRLAHDVIDWYGIDDAKVYAIQNAVEGDVFTPNIASKSVAREMLGIESEDRLVLYTGRFLVEKGVTYLMDAIDEVVAEVDDVSFLLVGGGYDERAVEKSLAGIKSRDKVITIPYVKYESMPYTYLASDVLVQPSLAEGLSRSILEAMACGLPIIATDVGGNPELVSSENGVLVKPRSAGDIAGAVKTVLSDEGLRARMGGNSRKRVLADFSVNNRVESFMRLYGRL